MITKELLANDLKKSMKDKNKVKTKVLRMALSSIKLVEVEKGEPIDHNRLIATLQKEVKTRQETLSEAEKAGRPEMVKDMQQEIRILKDYLPVEMNDAKLENLISQIIEEIEANSIKQMGLVMKESISQVAGRATNDRISRIVKKKLLS